MTAKTDYNGHKNRNFWNVNLWLWNDQFYYTAMKFAVGASKDKDAAAVMLLNALQASGKTHTPDGVKFTKSAVRAALRGL